MHTVTPWRSPYELNLHTVRECARKWIWAVADSVTPTVLATQRTDGEHGIARQRMRRRR